MSRFSTVSKVFYIMKPLSNKYKKNLRGLGHLCLPRLQQQGRSIRQLGHQAEGKNARKVTATNGAEADPPGPLSSAQEVFIEHVLCALHMPMLSAACELGLWEAVSSQTQQRATYLGLIPASTIALEIGGLTLLTVG